MSRSEKTVFVSGCFDLLHSGHVAFLQQAAAYGLLHVAVGSDATVRGLKGRHPVCDEQERLFMIRALRCVHDAFISSGSGVLDFAPELLKLRPHVFVVNSDGDAAEKRALCQQHAIEYILLERVPARGLPARSSTAARGTSRIPYRLDLAGGWLDQPFVSSLHPGPVIVLGLEPSSVFAGRSGLATSTRHTAERLWGGQMPTRDPLESARILFACENPPGTNVIAGSQDALGIALPGVNRLDYRGEYWPVHIERVCDREIVAWLGEHIFLKWLGDRAAEFDVLGETHLDAAKAQRLAEAAEACWSAILARDLEAFGRAVRQSFEAQLALFPRMMTEEVDAAMNQLPGGVVGYKLAGAGGGGYLVAIAAACPLGFDPIVARHAATR